MPIEEIKNNEGGLDIRKKLNRMFAELYGKMAKPKTYQELQVDIESEEAVMNVNNGLNAKIALTSDATISFENLENGDEGNILVIQGEEAFELYLENPVPLVINGGDGGIILSGEPESITVISYAFDGENLLVNYGKNYS